MSGARLSASAARVIGALTLSVVLSGCTTNATGDATEVASYSYTAHDENGTLEGWWNYTVDGAVYYPIGADGQFHSSVRAEGTIEGPGFHGLFQGFVDVATGLDSMSIAECGWPVSPQSCKNPYTQVEWGARSGSASILFGAVLAERLHLQPGTSTVLPGTPLERTLSVSVEGNNRLRVSPQVHGAREAVACNFLDDDTVVDTSTNTIIECDLRPDGYGSPGGSFVLERMTGHLRIGSAVSPPDGPGKLIGATEPTSGIQPAGSQMRVRNEITLAEAIAEANRDAPGFTQFLSDHPNAAIAGAGPRGPTSGQAIALNDATQDYVIDVLASAKEGHEVEVTRTTYTTALGQSLPPIWRVTKDAAATPSSLYARAVIARPTTSVNLSHVVHMTKEWIGNSSQVGAPSVSYRFTLDPTDVPAYSYTIPIGQFCPQPNLCIQDYLLVDGLQGRLEKAHIDPDVAAKRLFWTA